MEILLRQHSSLKIFQGIWFLTQKKGKRNTSQLKFKKKQRKTVTTLMMLYKDTKVIYEGLYFDLAQGQMNGAPNETRTHSCRFASLTC